MSEALKKIAIESTSYLWTPTHSYPMTWEGMEKFANAVLASALAPQPGQGEPVAWCLREPDGALHVLVRSEERAREWEKIFPAALKAEPLCKCATPPTPAPDEAGVRAAFNRYTNTLVARQPPPDRFDCFLAGYRAALLGEKS